MRAGKLNRRVTIQMRDSGQDAYGEPNTGWIDVVTDTPDHKVAAAINDATGSQYYAAQAGQNSVQTKIMIRYRTGILPSMRVLHGADIYDIETILVRGREWLDLMCVRGAGA